MTSGAGVDRQTFRSMPAGRCLLGLRSLVSLFWFASSACLTVSRRRTRTRYHVTFNSIAHVRQRLTVKQIGS